MKTLLTTLILFIASTAHTQTAQQRLDPISQQVEIHTAEFGEQAAISDLQTELTLPTARPGPVKPKEAEFGAITGSCQGCYNIHGMQNDPNMRPPSLNPDDWEILNDGKPVVHYSQVIGKRKIDPVGFYMTENNLALFYNSGWANYDDWERGMATNQTGSLIAFNDDWTFEDYPGNPVLYEYQTAWQGRNRVNPYALVWHPVHEVFYTVYGDFAEGGDGDKYTGRRALGLAKSVDMINWEYVSAEEPMLDIRQVYDIVVATRGKEEADKIFPNTRFNRQGRLYAFGAIWHNDQVYLSVGGSINGESYSLILRSRDMNEWKAVRYDEQSPRPLPIQIQGKWYRPQNTGTPWNPGFRAIAIAVSDAMNNQGENHHVFETGHTRSAGVSRQLFAYKGRWYIAWRQSDDENNRSLYIARER